MTVKNDGLQEILSGGIPTSEPDLSANPREAERLDREWEHFTVCFMLSSTDIPRQISPASA